MMKVTVLCIWEGMVLYIYTHTHFFFNFIFLTNGWFKFEIHQGGKSGPLFHSIHTSQFQVDYRSTCEKGSSSQKTHRRVAARFGDWNLSSYTEHKWHHSGEKTDEFESININRSCSSKGTIMRAKKQTTEWTKIYVTHVTIRVHFKAYKELLEVKKKTNKKWAINLNNFLKKRVSKCPLSIIKDCQLLSHYKEMQIKIMKTYC